MNDLLIGYLISAAITPNKIIAAIVLVVIVAGVFLWMRRRGRA